MIARSEACQQGEAFRDHGDRQNHDQQPPESMKERPRREDFGIGVVDDRITRETGSGEARSIDAAA
jgi:hypothetical protein